MTSAAHKQVGELMEAYFEGLHQADSTMLREVFHPQLAYVCATEGDELYLDLETYMNRVDGREPPAERGDPREEEILEIAFASGRLARVSARMTMMGCDFHDFLTLVRHGAEWRIVAKVFSYVPRKD
ncbi:MULTISPECIES: nuclear transport factor 2 family protein [Phaeobacter]|uniref:nuclear transport factor 2 family protein n=1 Tax=Phaeobacter TaxID=302485 RepID=UPI000C9B35A7|nr:MULTISPECIES: nuclear transport factor 2 family protein [Phaeobacter]AUQ56305.1 Putative lumazine-binding protein [Phaeobacter inhibens]AUQ80321.1 Putative lumazine-binding protein [Phaeobacter inhibens]AUR17480.1 Putative lumazine-binding protein [Phaeobacter inhibens]AUR37728.1 Putative lumazine-binding protein [Phaeobacter piscinae]